jgi:cyclophilin family peptidyl-prolyl cis-trans isomerase
MSDTTAPTVLITDNVTGIVNRSTKSATGLIYTLSFSEDVIGLDASDFSVTYGTVTGVTGSGSSWAISVTPLQGVPSGFIGLTLKDSAVADLAGNPNALSTNASQAIDTAAPVAPKLVTNASFNSVVDPQVTFQIRLGGAASDPLPVVFELNPDQAPVTVANMLAYVNTGFYDGTIFHRVADLNSDPLVRNSVVQGGGFNTGLAYKTPTYGPIVLESNNGLSNLKYTLAMARTSVANSATDQFYINANDNTFLNYASATSPGYAVFGKVVSGQSVIDAMAVVPTTTVGATANVPVTDMTTVTARQTLTGSAVSNTGLFTVSDVEAGARWAFSLDAGTNWAWGTGSTLAVPVGSYSAGAIRVAQIDTAGNWSLFDGLFTSALVVETTTPVVTGFSPADDATGVALGSDIVVTFSEAIQRGAGDIVLKTAAGVVATYNVANSSNLTIIGNTLTINPGADLGYGTRYVVEFAAGSLKDLAGNAYAGTTSYDFMTVRLTVPGTSGDDQLQGTAGDDIFTPALGNDSVNAGGGIDT